MERMGYQIPFFVMLGKSISFHSEEAELNTFATSSSANSFMVILKQVVGNRETYPATIPIHVATYEWFILLLAIL
jgi:hypothetical protein